MSTPSTSQSSDKWSNSDREAQIDDKDSAASSASAEQPPSKKMKPNYAHESFPISSLDNINEVIENPPNWVKRITPIRHRSTTVVQNTISDCHMEKDKFVMRPRLDKRYAPKTLVCHDYKGGYLDDKYLVSTRTGSASYTFYNWDHIDIFVYFSHHLITIPPMCWINAAHVQGVKILGTFITEFSDGEAICAKIFRDEDTMRIFATSLTQIAKIFRFDGWLLNIENKVENVDMLKRFVKYLSDSIHRDNSRNLVIWYDSVTSAGELKWQNELNLLNKSFFDHCDGIFLNYVWDEKHLISSAEFAKHRPFDVFVGIDVFGRNTFGGGQFNCYKAAQLIRRHNMSMALFAPGWTHETLEPKDKEQFFEDFINRDTAFWSSLWPYLYTHPITHFFRTKFFTGSSQHVFNMFNQEQQLSKVKFPGSLEVVPDYMKIPTLNNKCKCIQGAFFNTGAACFISKEYLNSALCYVHQLFTCDLDLTGTILVYYVTRLSNCRPATLNLNLITVNKNGACRKIKCLAFPKSHVTNDSTLLEVNPTKSESAITYVERRFENLLQDPVSVADCISVCVFEFTVEPCTLLEIGCTLKTGTSMYLCAFGIEKSVF